jgi:hypothetical protein
LREPTFDGQYHILMHRAYPFAAGCAILLVIAGCRKAEVTTYRVPKETPPPAPASATPAETQAAMAAQAVPTAGDDALNWAAPAHWQTGPAKPMRKATYLVPAPAGSTTGAELAVTAFPGGVGGNLANVNRWRQQLALPPITENDLPAALEHLHVGDLHVEVVELVSPTEPRQRVLGAIVPVAGATWFFKLTGPDSIVATEKPAFVALLQSLRPSR